LAFEAEEARCPQCLRKSSVSRDSRDSASKTQKPRYLRFMRWSPLLVVFYGLVGSATAYLRHLYYMDLATDAASETEMHNFVRLAARHAERCVAALILLVIVGAAFLGIRACWWKNKRSDPEQLLQFDQWTLIGSLVMCVVLTLVLYGVF
jgi:hypothetical protein